MVAAARLLLSLPAFFALVSYSAEGDRVETIPAANAKRICLLVVVKTAALRKTRYKLRMVPLLSRYWDGRDTPRPVRGGRYCHCQNNPNRPPQNLRDLRSAGRFQLAGWTITSDSSAAPPSLQSI